MSDILRNDKTTKHDELILILMVAGALLLGALLFFLFQNMIARILGVIFFIFAVMFIPAIIYRLHTNDEDATWRKKE